MLDRDPVAAAKTSHQRIELLASLPLAPSSALELKDALHNAIFCTIGAGDLPAARRLAAQHADLPFVRDELDLAVDELIAPNALSGDWAEALDASEIFLEGWRRAGEPVGPGRGIAPAAAALVHGLRGDDEARATWLSVLTRVRGEDGTGEHLPTGYAELFDAIVLLHHGHPADALAVLDAYPAETFYGRLLLQWHAGLLAEAAVLARNAKAGSHVERALRETTQNPVAAAIAERASALLAHDTDRLLETATAFERAGCRYQAARSFALAGGEPGRTDAAMFEQLGTAPIAQ